VSLSDGGGAARLENACLWRVLRLRLGWSRGAGVFGTVLTYADLPKVRAWGACAQLDIAAVFAMRKSEPSLSVLFVEDYFVTHCGVLIAVEEVAVAASDVPPADGGVAA
jgi:hypothetical protein